MDQKLLKNAVRVLVAALVSFFLVSSLPDLRRNVSKRDSIAYWAAARLLLEGQDPYDSRAVLDLERQIGYTDAKPLVLRTPPWSLFLVLPLGLLSAFWAWVVWVSCSLGAFVLSLHLCWKLYGRAKEPARFFWLIGYLFAPVPACLVAGQMGIILLLGIVLFLWWESRHPYLAGAMLILPLAKPHLLVVFWVTFALWLVGRKRWSVTIGLGLSTLAALATALAFRPDVVKNYQDMLRQAAIGSEFIPALSGVLRLLFFHHLFWVQFIPMAVALVWSLWFYYGARTRWNWCHHGLPLLVVSILTTPYAWITDEVVLIPVILQAALWINPADEHVNWRTKLVLILFACLNALLLLILWFKIPFSTGIYFWSSLVWFAWYLYGKSFSKQKASRQN